MQIDRLYDRLFETCSTINELNHLHILLENRMTPAEAAQLSAHIRRNYDRQALSRRADALRVLATRATGRLQRSGGARTMSDRERRVRTVTWAARLSHHLSLARTTTPSPVTRQWLRGGAAYYQAAGSPSSVLVIGFTGNARRLMMPTPQFLQHLMPFGADLLLLDVMRGSVYIEGVRGFSSDFPGTVDWLRTFSSGHGADRVVTVGTSGGAFPALLSGLALQVDNVLSAGAVLNRAAGYSRSGGTPALADVVAQYATSSPAPSVYLMFGCDSRIDTDAAHAVAATLPRSRLVPVEAATHGCLYPLAERGQLEDALASTLFHSHPAGERTVSG